MELLNYLVAKFEVLRAVKRDERGVTALEYGLMAGLVSLAIIAAITVFGTTLAAFFTALSAKVTAITP